MATGRTLARWSRVYVDGYDMSGYVSSLGPLLYEYETNSMAMLSDEVLGALPSHPNLGIGALNAVLATSTDSNAAHDILTTAGTDRDVLYAIGIRAAPAIGDPVYMGSFDQLGYTSAPADGMVTVTIPFGVNHVVAAQTYSKPWGVLLHDWSSETAANTSTDSADIVDNSASSTDGGWMMYQIGSITGAGTVTITIDESDDAESWTALSGATSGAITNTDAPISGIVKLGLTATVKRYLRFQVAFSSSTACTFALGFVRG